MNTQDYLDSALREFRDMKRLAEKAIAQIDDAHLFATPDRESNSIAVIMKHLAGNMRSRRTDFLTSAGEKPDRQRASVGSAFQILSSSMPNRHAERPRRLYFFTNSSLASKDRASSIKRYS